MPHVDVSPHAHVPRPMSGMLTPDPGSVIASSDIMGWFLMTRTERVERHGARARSNFLRSCLRHTCDETVEVADPFLLIERFGERGDRMANLRQIDVARMSAQKALDVGPVPIAPCDRFVHHQILGAGDRNADAGYF